jgi:integrase/recombinase XerD
MNTLQDRLQDYLALRRSLGFRLESPERHLKNFVAFAEGEGASHITTDLALRWATGVAHVQPATQAAKLGMVRRFAIWCSASDPRTEVPPQGLLPYRVRRKAPYIYTDEEIAKIIEAASRLSSSKGLRARSYSTVYGLLAVTGMRISEVVALDRRDVDMDEGILFIRRAKFGKARCVPVHPTTRDALAAYAEYRDRIFSVPFCEGFFVSERGARITDCSARYNFAKVSREIGLRSSAGGVHGTGPRLHDIRHRFAVKTMLAWYRAGLDAERELPKLATYLGHVHINDTYWYLEAVPELLALATERLIAGRGEARP